MIMPNNSGENWSAIAFPAMALGAGGPCGN